MCIPERWKGRLTAVRTKQREGIDYDETFAPMPREEAVKVEMTEIAALDLDVIH